MVLWKNLNIGRLLVVLVFLSGQSMARPQIRQLVPRAQRPPGIRLPPQGTRIEANPRDGSHAHHSDHGAHGGHEAHSIQQAHGGHGGHGSYSSGHGGHYSTHHYEDNKGKKFLNSLVEFPKGVAIGIRRVAGGLVALKGGWLRGQGHYLYSKKLKRAGDSLIDLGKKVAGPGPYGPEAPSPPF